ncbi:MAG TPA: hypothetical protein VGX68_08320 [Thermoanaerobaculia bacterium]|jgi:hypothetical protein|nr:hypothetical protein [Thermoanaerobaculia bacterium]
MTIPKPLMSSCLLSLLFAGSVSAVTLFSPPLVPEGNNVLDCYLVNVSNQAREVRIQIFSREGDVIETVKTTLEPGEEDVARAGANLLPRYCKFVVAGKKTDFRASVLVRQDGVGAISALPAE